MKRIVKAYPNKRYRHYNNLKNTHFEAVTENNKIIFFEVNSNGKRSEIPKMLVRECFKFENPLYPITSKPFLKEENKVFYELLRKS